MFLHSENYALLLTAFSNGFLCLFLQGTKPCGKFHALTDKKLSGKK